MGAVLDAALAGGVVAVEVSALGRESTLGSCETEPGRCAQAAPPSSSARMIAARPGMWLIVTLYGS